MIVLHILLWILIGIILLATLILLLPVGAIFDLDGKSFNLWVKAGPVKVRILPSKKKKNYKKLMRKLRGKAISSYEPSKKKAKKKQKKEASDSAKITDMIKSIAKNAHDTEGTNEWLTLIKIYSEMFKKDLHTELEHCYITVNAKEAADTCIRVGIISQALSYLIEFLNIFTSFTPPDEGKIYVNPSFDENPTTFVVRGKIRIRVFNIIKPMLSLLIKSIIK